MFFIQRAVLILIAIFILSIDTEAIIVVTPRDIGDSPGHSGEVALSIAKTSGNSATSTNDVSVALHYDSNTTLSTILINYTNGTSNGETNADKQFIHLRSVYPLKEDESFAKEYFIQYNRNLFTHLEERELFGAGIRKKVTGENINRLYFGLGVMCVREHEKNIDTEIFPSWSAYANYIMKLDDQKKLVSAIYVQPRVFDMSDFRSVGSIVLDVPLVSQVRLKYSINAEHDSKPAIGIKQNDIWTNLVLHYSFK